MPDPTELEKQAKDAVAACIAADPLAGPARTIPVMCQRISQAARLSARPKDGVIAASRGAMNAVLLGNQNVPNTAVALIDALPNMSLMMSAGPEELMSWVMEGIADVMPMAGGDVRDAVRTRIEEKYMGVSSIFDQLCDAAEKKVRG